MINIKLWIKNLTLSKEVLYHDENLISASFYRIPKAYQTLRRLFHHHSFIHSCINSFVRPFIHSFICVCGGFHWKEKKKINLIIIAFGLRTAVLNHILSYLNPTDARCWTKYNSRPPSRRITYLHRLIDTCVHKYIHIIQLCKTPFMYALKLKMNIINRDCPAVRQSRCLLN